MCLSGFFGFFVLFGLPNLFSNTAFAQIQAPVKFKSEFKMTSAADAEVVFTGITEEGWHIYSTGQPSGGPSSAVLKIDTISGARLADSLTPGKGEKVEYDNVFKMDLKFFDKKGTFIQKFEITDKDNFVIKGTLNYSACNNTNCLPPTDFSFVYYGDKVKMAENILSGVTGESFGPLWKPVIDQIEEYGGVTSTKNHTWIYIFIMGFAGGLLALFTPCVWPIIPMTVSFFLKRGSNRKKGIKDAVVYGLSIIIIYLSLGLIITGIFGASALNAMSTNALFNIFFFLLLMLFGLSFLGLFELSLPAKWSTGIDHKAEISKGFLSIFLMAFTLTLVSFSCTGPIIGFLLVEMSTLGSIAGPAIGMSGFALALALPFTFFALFPAWLNNAPKSGNWMTTLKVFLGFIEIAFAFKFLSVADLAYGWGLLNREVFLIIWIILALLMGLYMLGIKRFFTIKRENKQIGNLAENKMSGRRDGNKVIEGKMDSADPEERIGAIRITTGILSLLLAAYMIPGLWGAPCKLVSAFTPPMYTQKWNIYNNFVHAKQNDYEKGMELAKIIGKPVLLDFTGYGCVNCRKMEAAVWTDKEISGIINDRYILVTLFVDDKTPLKEPVMVSENGTDRKLRTKGDLWSYLQRYKFGANAQPFYVLLDNQGNPLAKPYSYNEDIKAYREFLESGLVRYNKQM